MITRIILNLIKIINDESFYSKKFTKVLTFAIIISETKMYTFNLKWILRTHLE